MPKHKRKHVETIHPTPAEIAHNTETSQEQEELEASNLPPARSLAEIRIAALRHDSDMRAARLGTQAEMDRTIAELEGWRDEIDCTIAFLKARR
jgi:hypothetical protein